MVAAKVAIGTPGKTTVFVDSADRYLKTIDEKGVLGAVGERVGVMRVRIPPPPGPRAVLLCHRNQ